MTTAAVKRYPVRPSTPRERLAAALERAGRARRGLAAVHDHMLRCAVPPTAKQVDAAAEDFHGANNAVVLAVFDVLGVDPMSSDLERDLELSLRALQVKP